MDRIKYHDCYSDGNIDIFLELFDWENRLKRNRCSAKQRNKKRSENHPASYFDGVNTLTVKPQNSHQNVL